VRLPVPESWWNIGYFYVVTLTGVVYFMKVKYFLKYVIQDEMHFLDVNIDANTTESWYVWYLDASFQSIRCVLI
jgi:hypothetical protein